MRTTHVREAFFPLAHGFTKAVCVIIAYGVSLLLILNGYPLPLATLVAISSTLDQVTGSLGDVCSSIADVFTLTTNLERIYDTIDSCIIAPTFSRSERRVYSLTSFPSMVTLPPFTS